MDNSFLKPLEDDMSKVVDSFHHDAAKYRPGRASANMLDPVKVDSYGSFVPLVSVAQVSVPEPTQLVVKPYDRSTIHNIASAIVKANLNLNPLVEADLIRINVPKLTEEIRKKMVKDLDKDLETFKVRVRNLRRDCINKLKNQDGVGKDELKGYEEDIQKVTDKYIAILDKAFKDKEQDIMSI